MNIQSSGNPFINVGPKGWWVIQVANVTYPGLAMLNAGHLFHKLLPISSVISCLGSVVFEFSLHHVSKGRYAWRELTYQLGAVWICRAIFAYWTRVIAKSMQFVCLQIEGPWSSQGMGHWWSSHRCWIPLEVFQFMVLVALSLPFELLSVKCSTSFQLEMTKLLPETLHNSI